MCIGNQKLLASSFFNLYFFLRIVGKSYGTSAFSDIFFSKDAATNAFSNPG